jgi:hypothetical protein
MGLQDRDYYGEKYWKLIEEEDKKPPQPPRIEKIYRPNFGFGRKWNQFLNFLKNIFSLIGLVWLILFITNYFRAPKPLSSKPPVSISESKQITSEEKENIWRIGETIRRGNFEYTLNWVKIFPVWIDEESSDGKTYYKRVPKENFEFVVINLTAKNIGIKKSSPEYFEIKAKSIEGYLYETLETKDYLGWGEEKATPQEVQNYFCKYFSSFHSIYPEETITGCRAVTIHQNREPAEIFIKFSTPWEERQKCVDYLFEKDKYEKCLQETEAKNIYIVKLK